MTAMDNKLKSFFKEVEPYVVTFYAGQRDIFKGISWDYKDLKQEILIVLWNQILKMEANGKTDVDQIKYFKKSIKNIVIEFWSHAKAKKRISFVSFSPSNGQSNEDEFTTEIVNDEFVFESVKPHLSEKEYEVIYALFHDGKPISLETAKELGYKAKTSLTFHRDSALVKLSKLGLGCRQNTSYPKEKDEDE